MYEKENKKMAQDEAMLLRRFFPVVVAAVVGIGVIAFLAHRHFTRPAENSDPAVTVEQAPASSGAPAVPPPPALEPKGSDAPAEPIRRNEAQATPQTRMPEPAPDRPLVREQPSETTADTRSSQIDLSSPEATVRSFTRLMATGNAEAVMACFLPGGIDYQDMKEILAADASDPRQRDKHETRLWLQSLDPEAKMPIIETKQKADGVVEITWEVVFKKDLTMEGQTFAAGQTMNLDAQLVKSDGKWLINGI